MKVTRFRKRTHNACKIRFVMLLAVAVPMAMLLDLVVVVVVVITWKILLFIGEMIVYTVVVVLNF